MKIAAIRIRGGRVERKIADALTTMKLTNQNIMVVYENKPSVVGALKKVKDYITWGELDAENEKKYGETDVHTMHPPRGGFERKGIKKSFSIGGALGYRGDKINELIVKMSK
ncbi:uL30 family ribosomal protein [Candidatus Woesearchaeota archaeon]|nr:uL30 family ribosomal protein [Candidatus Woesearchaeota archaeon]